MMFWREGREEGISWEEKRCLEVFGKRMFGVKFLMGSTKKYILLSSLVKITIVVFGRISHLVLAQASS